MIAIYDGIDWKVLSTAAELSAAYEQLIGAVDSLESRVSALEGSDVS